MQIKRLAVKGLGHSDRLLELSFNRDLNILTGKNGSGKTTILKLLWYLISGNIEHAAAEIPFTEATLETTHYTITVNKSDQNVHRIQFIQDDLVRDFLPEFDDDGDAISNPSFAADTEVLDIGSSIFFPTFRRIEGGFSIKVPQSSRISTRLSRPKNALEEAMQELARRLSNGNHLFVASISTTDIVQLLLRQYTEMSEKSNNNQQSASDEIIAKIKNYKLGKDFIKQNPDEILEGIKVRIEKLDKDREDILAPLTAVRILAERLFQHEGIALGTRISFGDAAQAVSSDSLSAGEKQMLSFICYNAFYKDSVIFIDEPELSLHVDWQRQLFAIMEHQGTDNQFVIATHSPFIYGKFPDKELQMSKDRGE